jgi:hypothetical protein
MSGCTSSGGDLRRILPLGGVVDWVGRVKSDENHDEMYGQKVVRKGVQKAPRNPKSPVKQANRKPNEGQKGCKKWTSKKAPKIEGRDPPRIHLKLTTNRPEIDQYLRQNQEC